MSVDPSAIPNFGGQPEKPENKTPGQGGARKPAGPIMPNQDLIKQLLERMKLKYVTDKEGDLVAPWEKFRTYFMFRGEKQQRILSVRTFYDRPHTIEEKGRLLETIDEWNRRTLWPKVYTHTNDDGTVRLIGEAQMLIGLGVAPDHFVNTAVSWIRAAIEFDKWLVETLGLEKDAESGDGDGTNGGDEGEGGTNGGTDGTGGEGGTSGGATS
ncbi:YbjN domain-containing protein [Streptomyces cheonanensis]|uniref:YbjN domain-containing protein n=1 Tax=Streptomyces cheonanensis TaxID=312720 RepID=A0ABN2V5W8_9ACTN|nr:YbjN domain-containing protein [Streptomyces harbinensis]QKV69931.1 YbjN domain-containing protein [Streptomyces harbinensis]